MADARLLAAQDHVVALEYHQFFLSSCLCAEEDYSLDIAAVDAMHDNDLLQRATAGDGIAQDPVDYTFSGTLLVLSPQEYSSEMPLRVELWDGPPPDDTADWPEAVEAHLDVDPHGLWYTTFGRAARLDVPPGGYHALITGRGFIAYGSVGADAPDVTWRIRLWPSPGPQAARRLSEWHGERELSAEQRDYLDGRVPEAYRLLGLDQESSPGAVVRAIDELVGRVRAEHPSEQRTAELWGALGSLLGRQWCDELGWHWSQVSLRRIESFGVVPPDSRYVYFPVAAVYDLLTGETEDVNLLSLFTMAAAGDLPPASGNEHLRLG